MQRVKLTARDEKGRFNEPQAGPGRPKGSKNKASRLIREAAIIAAEAYGSDGNGKDGLVGLFFDSYRTERKAMLQLLGKLLPMQVNMRDDGPQSIKHYETAAEVREELQRRGIRVPEYLKPASRSDDQRNNPFRRNLRSPLTIEHRHREHDDD